MLPANCNAAPRAAALGATVICPAPVPAAALTPSRIAPALILRGPVQVALAAFRTSTPLSFLLSVFPTAERVNGAVNVRVRPCTTSMAVLV